MAAEAVLFQAVFGFPQGLKPEINQT